MSRSISRRIRFAFVALTSALLLLVSVESFAGKPPTRMGLSTCGWDGNPCVLEPLVVKPEPLVRAEPSAKPEAKAVPVRHLHTVRPSTPDARS